MSRWQKVKAGHYVTEDLICEAVRREFPAWAPMKPYWVLSVQSQYVWNAGRGPTGLGGRVHKFRTLADVKAYVEKMQ